MSSQSSIDLCNRALLRIGSDRISDFNGGSVASEIAAEEYEPRVAERLTGVMPGWPPPGGSAFEWRFAMKNDDLGTPSSLRETDPDAWDHDPWLAIYNIPADLLAIRAVRLNGRTIPFIRMGEDLLCDETANVKIEYTFRQTEANFTSYFTAALVEDLAAFFALSIKRDGGLAKLHGDQAMTLWAAARLADSKAMTPKVVKASRVVASRFGG